MCSKSHTSRSGYGGPSGRRQSCETSAGCRRAMRWMNCCTASGEPPPASSPSADAGASEASDSHRDHVARSPPGRLQRPSTIAVRISGPFSQTKVGWVLRGGRGGLVNLLRAQTASHQTLLGQSWWCGVRAMIAARLGRAVVARCGLEGGSSIAALLSASPRFRHAALCRSFTVKRHVAARAGGVMSRRHAWCAALLSRQRLTLPNPLPPWSAFAGSQPCASGHQWTPPRCPC